MSVKRRQQKISRDPAVGDRIKSLYYEGLNFNEIGAAVGYSPTSVRLHLRRTGDYEPIDTNVAKRIAGAVAWYERGTPVAAILSQFRISANTLYRHLHRQNVPLRISQ